MFRSRSIALLLLLLSLPASATEKSRRQQLAELFALIDQSDQIVVYSEGFKRESEIYRSRDRKDFDELKAAITLKPKGGPFACACVDGPEIALLKNNKEIASVWNHEGTAIGSSVWDGDWRNSNPDQWLHWFDARAMTSARQFFNQMQTRYKKSAVDEQRWVNAIPSSLKPFWPEARRQYNPPNFPDLTPLAAALQRQYPDRNNRIRALMAWYGSGAGPWSGFPGYEEIAEKLLRQYPTVDLIKAIENRNLEDRELEGAARILGGWTPFPDHAPIPEQLRRTLLEHCLKSTDEDKLDRAKKAFGTGS